MARLRLYVFTFPFISIILFSFFSCSNYNANRLFNKATKLVEKAQKTEETSYFNAYKFYDEAFKKVEKIKADYPSSKLANQIDMDVINIGPYKISDFIQNIVPDTKLRADAEINILDCGLYVAQRINSPLGRLVTLSNISFKYSETGQANKSSEITSQARQLYDQLYKDNNPYRKNYYEIVGTWLRESYPKRYQIEKNIEYTMIITETVKKITNREIECPEHCSNYEKPEFSKSEENAFDKADEFIENANNYIKEGKSDKAIEMLSKAMKLSYKIKGTYYKDKNLLTKIAIAYSEAGKYDLGYQVIKAIENQEAKEEAIIITTANHAVSISFENAQHEASKMGLTIDKPAALALASIKYAENRQLEQALNTAQTIAPNTSEKYGSVYFKYLSLAIIAIEYAEVGQFQQAFQVIKTITPGTIEEDQIVAKALKGIIVHYIKLNRNDPPSDQFFAQALQVVDMIGCFETSTQEKKTRKFNSDPLKAELLDLILENYIKFKNTQENISKIFSKAIEIAKTIGENDSPNYRSIVLGIIAIKYSKAGLFDKAFELTNIIFSSKGIGKDELLLEILNNYAGAGYYDKSFRIAEEEICSTAYRDKSFGLIIEKYAENGKYDEALQEVNKRFFYNEEKAITLANIGAKYLLQKRVPNDKLKKDLYQIIRNTAWHL